jgi:translation initiation factor IF-3
VPPVCKILDFGKFKYEEKKKLSEAKKKQTVVEVKEIKIRPKTDDHDLDVKVRAIRRFIEAGNKVKVTCRFRGREITHPERAQMQLTFILSKIEDLANVEQRPTMEARTMSVLVAPKPAVFQRLSILQREREKEREREGKPPGEKDDVIEEELDEALHEEDDDDDDDDDDDAETGEAVTETGEAVTETGKAVGEAGAAASETGKAG